MLHMLCFGKKLINNNKISVDQGWCYGDGGGEGWGGVGVFYPPKNYESVLYSADLEFLVLIWQTLW